jgi:hypothetical protein
MLACAIAMFADVLAAGGTRVVSMAGEDTTRPFFYWLPFGFGALRHGHLVLWNPHTYGGTPFFGAFGPALLYPLNWLHMVLPTAVGINVGVCLHVFLAGVFVYAWAAQRRLHPGACLTAGLVFMFCGAHFLQIARGHLHCLTTLVWAPLIFLAIDAVVDGRSRAWALVGMAAVAMQILAGHVQYTFYTGIIAGAYALLRWWGAGRRLRHVPPLVAIYAGGAALAAVQLLTGLQTAIESHRTALTFEMAAFLGFPPENVVTLVLPGIFGDMVRTAYWGHGTLTEMSLFIGVAPFVLMLYGIVGGERRLRAFSLPIALVVLVLAFGDYTPLFRILYDHVPGFASFRGTTKFIFLAALFFTMLVAVGLDALWRSRGAPRWLAVTSLGVGSGLLALGASFAWDCPTGGWRFWRPALQTRFFEDAYQYLLLEASASESVTACTTTGGSLLIAGAVFAVVGLLLLGSRRRPALIWAVAAIGVVEVMAHARYTLPTFDPTPLPKWSAALRQALAERDAGSARILSTDPYSYVAMGAGAFDLWGAEPAVPGRYARFVRLTQQWHRDSLLGAPGMRRVVPLFGMMRLRYLLQVEGEAVRLQPTGLKELPRALLVPTWTVVTDGEALITRLGSPDFDPARAVLLESDPGLPRPADDAPAEGDVRVVDHSTDVIELDVTTARPAILVVTDNYSASWKASPWDGASASTYRVVPANYTLRGIPLPAGRHHLRLEYRPTALAWGAWITAIAVAAYGSALVLLVTRRRRSSSR